MTKYGEDPIYYCITSDSVAAEGTISHRYCCAIASTLELAESIAADPYGHMGRLRFGVDYYTTHTRLGAKLKVRWMARKKRRAHHKTIKPYHKTGVL